MAKPAIFAIVAGELSGDILGAGLIRALKEQHPDAEFVGIGGPLMQAEGLESLYPLEDLAVMGLVEVLGRLPRLLSIKNGLISQLLRLQPDCYIGVDAPDFNLRIEAELKPTGIPTIHYVSPSVWAWRPKRIFKIDKATDMVLALLPFEKAFYDKHNVACEFVGHTLADEIPLESNQAAARTELSIGLEHKVLAMLPGSRGGEMSRLADVFLETAAMLQQRHPTLEIVVPLANQQRREQLLQALEQTPKKPSLTLLDGQSRQAMIAADAVMLASGTATLEAMLVKRPMVVAYKVAPMSYRIAKRLKLMLIDRFSLPNLLGQNLLDNKDLVPEFIQHDCHADNLVESVEDKLFNDQSALLNTFTELHQTIRCDASKRAAEVVLQVISNRNDRKLEALVDAASVTENNQQESH